MNKGKPSFYEMGNLLAEIAKLCGAIANNKSSREHYSNVAKNLQSQNKDAQLMESVRDIARDAKKTEKKNQARLRSLINENPQLIKFLQSL